MKKTEYLLENFKNIQDLIKFADQKAAAILVVCGLILTIFIETAKKLTFSNQQNDFWGVITFLTGVAVIILIVLILYHCIFLIIKPKFANNYSDEQYSTFYFEHIAKNSLELLKTETESINDERISKDITEQIHEVSKILLKKNKALASSMNLLFITVAILLVFVLAYQMIKV